jgi:hypothetical protein
VLKAKCLVAEARIRILLQNQASGNPPFFFAVAIDMPMQRRQRVCLSRVFIYLFLQIQTDTTVVLGFSTHLPFF